MPEGSKRVLGFYRNSVLTKVCFEVGALLKICLGNVLKRVFVRGGGIFENIVRYFKNIFSFVQSKIFRLQI